jgi:pimeloyl-ACP methyl ester carboxylesterase
VPDSSAIFGTAAFLAGSGALVYAGALAGVVKEALRPERKTVGWALGRQSPIEPTAWGLAGREWSHAAHGATCPVFDVGSDDPHASTVVVLHGFSRSRYDSLGRLGPMLPFAQRFLCPDLPGHGDAAGRGTRLGTDEERFVESLILSTTKGRILLVGHSLGATIALHTATLPSIAERISGLVLLAPYESLRTPISARLDLRALPRRPLAGATMRALAAFGVRERSSRMAAALVKAPVAVVAGGSDPVTPVSEARAIAESASQHRFTLIPAARHDDFHTAGREEMRRALAWIQNPTEARDAV